MVKYECVTPVIASELRFFLMKHGWNAQQFGHAVLSDIPELYKGSVANAMIKIAMPNEGDLKINLEG